MLCFIYVDFLETTIAEELFDRWHSINCRPTYMHVQVPVGKTSGDISETSTYHYYASQFTSNCIHLLTLYPRFRALLCSVSDSLLSLLTHFYPDLLCLLYERQIWSLFNLPCFSSHLEFGSTYPLYLLKSNFAIQFVRLYCFASQSKSDDDSKRREARMEAYRVCNCSNGFHP